MKLLVLGGGAQGRVIGVDLARALPAAAVTVADVKRPELGALPNLTWVEADLSSVTTAARLMAGHDLVVGALPARFGYGAMQAAIEAKRNLVDVSFCAENPLALDSAARAAGIAILPDCGLAPGLSHLAVGRAAAEGTPDEVMIYVGGVAQDRAKPYGYVITWSLEDLEQEYLRPARVVEGGRPVTVPVFSGLERVTVEGAGELEAFYSDGLRTLIDTLPGVPTMGEKTLRWPGHVAAVKPLVETGGFIAEFRARCTNAEPRDLVAMLVRVRRGGREQRMTLVDRYDAATRMTAMARTTALTTSAVAQLAASGGVVTHGVLPLERVGPDAKAYAFITGCLARHGIRPQWTERAVAA
jgi:lysine 6-dehydrogenase